MQKNEFDVLIVGAGLSGLAAAQALISSGKSVMVVEAKGNVGGRTYASTFGTSDRQVDWGAEWVIPDLHPRMMELIEHYGFSLESEDGELRWEIPGFTDLASYDDLRRKRPSFDQALARLQDWADAPEATSETTVSIADLLADLIVDDVDRRLVEAALFPLTGADPTEVSARALRKEIEFHAQSIHQTIAPATYRLGACCGELTKAIAATLPAASLRLNWPVTEIETLEGNDVLVKGPCGEVRAKSVLVSAPVASLHQILFTPEIPGINATQSARMNAGKVVKIWARVHGKCPTARLAIGHPLRLVYAWEKAEGEILVSAQALAKDLVGKDLKVLLSEACPGSEIVEIEQQHWPADAYARGSWMAAQIGAYAPDVFADGFGPVRVIGGDVAASWAGWMEGAVLSGENAARAILAG